ncbi:uncharacterized protein LOC127150925 [Cucumis melo]|uniref:Uncharacterized protein LOC127148498 n=1 Tax=Cucumis melo TaxID=3656 RepID=A0ABM3L6M7_CUCME|nr:uncharacterized protein LOC127148498 [Cucumis melo]XP_050939939.1 uncharacterized protein LOC127149087 [Cucumis melo]XP_050939940.1 uncharacterized protein LOC127149087 [Cucumis melo]XP_050945691.1 uncharacterized protein LOC127150925 [Cucumis melo]XP_050945692.1 uncharacterized protein LOC127150925 [Cucumis melo]
MMYEPKLSMEKNLQLHRCGHNLPWKLRQRSSNESAMAYVFDSTFDCKNIDAAKEIYGALRMFVKMHLMWNSKILIDGGDNEIVATSLLEANVLYYHCFSVSMLGLSHSSEDLWTIQKPIRRDHGSTVNFLIVQRNYFTPLKIVT